MKLTGSPALAIELIFIGVMRTCAIANAQSSTPTATAAPRASAPYTLRYQFIPGRTRRSLLTVDMVGNVINGGASQPLNQHMEETVETTVAAVRASDGAATVTSTISNIKLVIDGNNFPLPASQLTAMEKPTTVIQTPLGKNLSITYSSANPTNLPGFDLNSIGDFGSLAGLPAAPIPIGGSWRGSALVPALANTAILVRSTLISVDPANTAGAEARIEDKYYGSTPAAGGKEFMRLPYRLNVLMTGTGESDFDMQDGYVRSSTGKIDMKMTMTPTAPSTKPAQPIHMNFKVTTTMTVIDANAQPTPPAPAPPDAAPIT